MKFPNAWLLLAIAVCPAGAARAQLAVAADTRPQCVFSGGGKPVSVTFQNAGGPDFEGEIHARVLQATSATAAPRSDTPWQKISVPAGESVLATATPVLPAVRWETRFLIQWLDDRNRVIGKTEVLAYPTNLLAELSALAGGDRPVGVFDPADRLKPLLRNLRVRFTDLGNIDLENFPGGLAIIGPFESMGQMRDGLAGQIKGLAKKGAAVIWLRPPPEERDTLTPSFYTVQEDTGAVVIAQPDLVADLADNPQSQLNLIKLCKLALNPQSPTLPGLARQP